MTPKMEPKPAGNEIVDVKTVLLTGPCSLDPFLLPCRAARSAAFIEIHTKSGDVVGLGETYAGYFVPEAVPPMVDFHKAILVGQDVLATPPQVLRASVVLKHGFTVYVSRWRGWQQQRATSTTDNAHTLPRTHHNKPRRTTTNQPTDRPTDRRRAWSAAGRSGATTARVRPCSRGSRRHCGT